MRKVVAIIYQLLLWPFSPSRHRLHFQFAWQQLKLDTEGPLHTSLFPAVLCLHCSYSPISLFPILSAQLVTSSPRLSTAFSPLRSMTIILPILCLTLLTSTGAARVLHFPHESRLASDIQWQQSHSLAEEPALAKRADSEDFDYLQLLDDTPFPQLSSALASQPYTHGLLPEESHIPHGTHQPAAWDMSHHHPCPQDPSYFHAQSAYWSHNPCGQLQGQGLAEVHDVRHQSHVQNPVESVNKKSTSRGKRKRRSEASERDQSSSSKGKPRQRGRLRKEAKPRFPTVTTTREELEAAMIFYGNELSYRSTENRDCLKLSPERRKNMPLRGTEMYDKLSSARDKYNFSRRCAFDPREQ